MRVVQLPRGAGKTTTCLEWLRADPTHHVLLVYSEREADRLRELITEDDWHAPIIIDPRRIVSPSSLSSIRGLLHPVIGIDNLELVLPNLLHAEIDLVTWSDST